MAEVYDIVTIQNIDDEDFEFQYNASEGNAPYVIPAGEVVRYPSFLANHAIKHLIDKILTKEGERTNHETKRDELMEKIVVGSEKIGKKAEPSESELLKRQVKDLNAPTTLESILQKREASKKSKEEVGTKPHMEKEEEEETFEGLEDKKVVKETPPEPKPVKKPTKAELLTYAEKQNLVLDEKDKQGKTLRDKLTKMKVDDIIKEIDYPLE